MFLEKTDENQYLHSEVRGKAGLSTSNTDLVVQNVYG